MSRHHTSWQCYRRAYTDKLVRQIGMTVVVAKWHYTGARVERLLVRTSEPELAFSKGVQVAILREGVCLTLLSIVAKVHALLNHHFQHRAYLIGDLMRKIVPKAGSGVGC